MLESGLGLSPWDVLNQGIAEHTVVSFGTANILVGLAVMVIAWALGARIGLGTVANAVGVGFTVDALLAFDAVGRLSDLPLAGRVALLFGGIALIGVGSALYIGATFGAGPRDSLMLVGAARTKQRIGLVRAELELSALAVGWMLGGTVGIGTLAFALLIGPSIEAAFTLLHRSPLARRVEPTGR
jgi:uncharacterized protein